MVKVLEALVGPKWSLKRFIEKAEQGKVQKYCIEERVMDHHKLLSPRFYVNQKGK